MSIFWFVLNVVCTFLYWREYAKLCRARAEVDVMSQELARMLDKLEGNTRPRLTFMRGGLSDEKDAG